MIYIDDQEQGIPDNVEEWSSNEEDLAVEKFIAKALPPEDIMLEESKPDETILKQEASITDIVQENVKTLDTNHDALEEEDNEENVVVIEDDDEPTIIPDIVPNDTNSNFVLNRKKWDIITSDDC